MSKPKTSSPSIGERKIPNESEGTSELPDYYRFIFWLNSGLSIWTAFMPVKEYDRIVLILDANLGKKSTREKLHIPMENVDEKSVFLTASLLISDISGYRVCRLRK